MAKGGKMIKIIKDKKYDKIAKLPHVQKVKQTPPKITGKN